MAKKLYVGSLPYSVNESSLRELFEPFGEITSVAVISDKFTGQSKGFGFVEFSDSDAADSAIAQLNGKEMGGRTLTVNEAKPQEKRSGGGGFGGGGNRGGGYGGNRSSGGGGGRRY